MVAFRALLDTNVLIYALRGNRRSASDFFSHPLPGALAISRISWMEVLVGAPPDVEAPTRSFLEQIEVLELNREVSERAVQIRRETKLKLPDAIIYATALVARRTLVTYNTRDFPPDLPSVHIPAT